MARENLIARVHQCTLCRDDLPLPPRPILQYHRDARILIAGQAPGRVTHDAGIPFDDASGNRLRDWMGLTRDAFYDESLIAVVPMAFCFPGRGTSGDLPPLPRCAETWRQDILDSLHDLRLTIVLGKHALNWHLPGTGRAPLSQVVGNWQAHAPHLFVLPHPSPRNNPWLAKNPWFEKELLPALRTAVESACSG